MTLLLSGTNGVSDVDGTAATPAIRGSDTNTGIFFPAADTIAFAEGGVESARFDSAGNLGIGTSSPASRLHVNGVTRISGVSAGSTALFIPAGDIVGDVSSGSMAIGNLGDSSSETRITTRGFTTFRTGATDGTNGTERARIDSSGNLLVGRTANVSAGARIATTYNANAGNWGMGIQASVQENGTAIGFVNTSGTTVGTIAQGISSTAYNTSSDYRLKHDIQPMTGALAKVALLKPCTYKWNADDSEDEGFIAHELQEVCPSAVTGEKDAVDAEGNPQYQGIDTSFLVATLTAAIQELHAQHIELKAIVDQQATEIANLKGQA